MKDASEDEQEEASMASESANPRISKSRSERAEQLRKMMEDEGKKTSARNAFDLMTDAVHRRGDGRHWR